MFRDLYNQIIEFASQGELADELTKARAEFEERTGKMFESDESYERRIAAFLEWYVLDRPVSGGTHQTPAKLYVDSIAEGLTTPELQQIRDTAQTTLSLFEFRRAKPDYLLVVDLLRKEKHQVFERRKPAGLESGDIMEARLVHSDDKLLFSDVFSVHPREPRKLIRKAAKSFRKAGNGADPVGFVHRVAYLSNRCERYGHVSPLEIFAEL